MSKRPKRDKLPHAIVRRGPRGLSPVSAYDAEALMAFPNSTEFELVPIVSRSRKQLGTYWMMLRRVVNATDAWPSAVYLSDEIKITLGYRHQLADMRTGEIHTSVDSIALDAMTQAEFSAFFDQAQKLLTEKLGFDTLAFLEEVA